MVTSAEVEAIEANLWEFGTYLGNSPLAELHRQPDMSWYATGIPSPMLNGVFGAQLAPGRVDERIALVAEYFRSRRLPMMWWVGPNTQPGDLGQRLQRHGFARLADMPGMAVNLAELNDGLPLPSGLKIKPVRDSETLEDWAYPFALSFGFPGAITSLLCRLFASLGLSEGLPLQHYAAYLDGAPVGGASLFVGDGVAGIYNVAVVPDKRRRGIGETLTREVLYKARQAGYELGILHSSPMGFNLYRRVGFRQHCTIATYVLA